MINLSPYGTSHLKATRKLCFKTSNQYNLYSVKRLIQASELFNKTAPVDFGNVTLNMPAIIWNTLVCFQMQGASRTMLQTIIQASLPCLFLFLHTLCWVNLSSSQLLIYIESLLFELLSP